MRLVNYFILLLLFFLPTKVVSQYQFKTLDSGNGLNCSQINCIYKDSRGYMWFGTPAGLYRYDGYTFKNFQCDSQDGTSLPDSYIKSIIESPDGNLWIETASGLCIYQPITETFERDMSHVFSKMGINGIPYLTFFDSNDNLWVAIANEGVFAYNLQQQLLYDDFTFANEANGIPQGYICDMTECKDGVVLVYDNGRLVCCNINTQKHTQWIANDIANQKILNNKQLKAFTDQMDNIWIYGQGALMVYNKNTGIWNKNIGNTLGLSDASSDNTINEISGDRQGNIWLATDKTGLIRTKVNSLSFENIILMNNAREYRDIKCIQSVYVDDTDLLWVGTEKAGVAYYGKDIYKFQSFRNGDITAITQDKDGNIWYGTNNQGVIGYNGKLASSKVTAMTTTPDGSIWVGSKQNGLTRIKDGESEIYSVAKDSLRTIINDQVKDLCTDKTGNLWIATSGGLQIFNYKLNTFSTYTQENKKISTNNITTLFYGKGNNLYIGTGEGLIIMNLSSTDKTVLTGNRSNLKKFTNNYITQVFEDSRGLIWIGTREGLNILNSETDALDHLTIKDGLCNNSINGIAEDNNKNIWITTSNGISRVVVQRNHEEGTFNYGLYNYDKSDGLQSNEFNPGAILTNNKGEVIFGGLSGVDWIRTESRTSKEALPKVMLTQLFINEEEIQTGNAYKDRIILPQALNESRHIKLDNSQNSFTIKFAAGNYNHSERLQFMYWMEGLDTNWKNGDALTHGVTFHNLETGEYILHVKAISADGSVSNQERTLIITILPPWWLSWWMLCTYAIIILIIIFLWRYGIKKIKYIWSKKKTIINELHNQREEIKAASEDLRQPMARMTSIISNLSEKEKTLEGKEQLNSMHFQMLQIITRLSEMQMALENPESKANESAVNRLQLNDNGIVCLPNSGTEELTAEIRQRNHDALTMKYTVMIIDNNDEFLKFIMAHLHGIYDTHGYNDITKAIQDIEVLKTDIIICKQDMPKITGSELCNRIKTHPSTEGIKFVLMTDSVLTPQDMQGMNITLSADDYLAKPFNIQEAVIRLNKLLGIETTESPTGLIEGEETRRLESLNSSMTTATTSYTNDLDLGTTEPMENQATNNVPAVSSDYKPEELFIEYNMSDIRDQQLMQNVEQYVLHNMSRGQINLEDMAAAMGMGRVPFFHKIKGITGKTPVVLVKELRLKHACIMLEKTDLNLSELANNIGLLTAENFINIFKDRFGISPSEYRMRHRKGEQ